MKMRVLTLFCFMSLFSLFSLSARAEMPKVGAKAPLFSGQDQDGKVFNLADHIGKKIVLLILPIGG